MSTPAGLVAAALALWGVAIGQLVLGLVLGAAFELARHAPPSAAVAARLRLVLKGCSIAAVVLLAYVATAQSLPNSLYTWLRWLPLLLLPIPALAGMAGGLRVRGREVDTTHAYAALTLAAAGTGVGAAGWLYAGYAAIAGWALLARAGRPRLATAAVMFVGAAAIGHAVHTGIWLLQGQVEEWSTDLFQEFFAGKTDPFRERTRIGDLGRIKLSDRILLRVEVERPRPGSILLRESSFERYRNGEWHNIRPRPRPVPREGEGWIVSDLPAAQRLWVRRSFPEGEGVLALPPGTRVIQGLAGADLEAFPSGTVRLRGAPRFAAYGVAYDPAEERLPPDPRADLDVPPALADVAGRAMAARDLRQADAAAKVAAVRAHFDDGYAYSLDLGERPRTLAAFLLTDKKGHCEYFASGTVMLLRALGVPARYAAGYSAQEWSELEQAFVVRNRHAHAWAQAFVDGRWIDVDTTPSRWAELEAEEARGILAPALDVFSWAVESLVRAWLAADPRTLAAMAAMLAVAGALAVAAVVALRRWRRRSRASAARPGATERAWRGLEARLAKAGYRRADGETVRAFSRRLAREHGTAPWAQALDALARRYYRARFDPAAPAAEADDFMAEARRWAAAFPRQGRST